MDETGTGGGEKKGAESKLSFTSPRTQTSFDHKSESWGKNEETKHKVSLRHILSRLALPRHVNQKFGRATSASVTQQTFATRESFRADA